MIKGNEAILSMKQFAEDNTIKYLNTKLSYYQSLVWFTIMRWNVGVRFSYNNYYVGGVTQWWLWRRSLAGGLSLIYAWSMVDMWPLRGYGVRYGTINQANSDFHLFGVGKWVVIHVILWISGMETIKRHTRHAYGCLIASQSPMATGLAYGL